MIESRRGAGGEHRVAFRERKTSWGAGEGKAKSTENVRLKIKAKLRIKNRDVSTGVGGKGDPLCEALYAIRSINNGEYYPQKEGSRDPEVLFPLN